MGKERRRENGRNTNGGGKREERKRKSGYEGASMHLSVRRRVKLLLNPVHPTLNKPPGFS